MTEKSLREEIEEIHRAEQPLQKYWAQLVAVCLICVSAGGILWRVDTLAEDIKENKENVERNSINAQNVAQKLVRIEGNQERFKNDIDELKEQNEKLDDKLDKILEEIRKQ